MSAPSHAANVVNVAADQASLGALRSALGRVALNEDINFLVTNRIPRQLVTQFMGWFGKRTNPIVRDLSLLVWRLFADVNLDEAAKKQFASLHDCFIRELKP